MASEAKSPIREYWIPLLALVGLSAYLLFCLAFPDATWKALPLIIVIAAGGIPLLWKTLVEVRHGKFNVDLIAIASIFGGLVVGQYLAAAIIVLMMSGGEALEAFALRRASGSLASLLKQRPRLANKWNGTEYVETTVEDLEVGDQLLIRPGESVPTDAEIIEGTSDFNESLLTGESVPVPRLLGDVVMAGSINLTGPVTATVKVPAGESTYAKIVKLVQDAQERKAPIQRIADQFGVWFTPLTFLLVAITWLITRNEVTAYSVLVIATPCPLILATPVAIIAGIGRAAKLGIIIKSGVSLEGVARASSILFDKTGTITTGVLTLVSIEATDKGMDKDEALALFAALEQYSNHVVATSIVSQAKHKGLKIQSATGVKEVPGNGLRGEVAGKNLLVGNASFLSENDVKVSDKKLESGVAVYLALNKKHCATIILQDVIRPESKGVVTALVTKYGFSQAAMLTGDRVEVAEAIAKQAGVKTVFAGLKPEDKVTLVEKKAAEAHAKRQTVIMVGDGINDAPALERADIGIAIGKQGGEIAVEAADIVLLGNRLARLTDAVRIGRAVLKIATQGIWFGMACSLAGMGAAAFGYLPPVGGAISQEVIDVIVILNALRVLKV